MKAKIILLILILAAGAGAAWFAMQHLHPQAVATNGRKILYYQSSMHPWIKSDKPGKCPICGMDLVPVYEDNSSGAMTNAIVLKSNSVNVLNVQTATVQRRQIVHSLHVAGIIEMDVHPTHFVFTAYERDFAWLDVDQKVEVTIPSVPGKTYDAKITRVDSKFQDASRSDLTHGLQVRATLSESLVQVNGIKRSRPFDGFYAEGRVIANTPNVLAVPRSAVLSPGGQSFVYVDNGKGDYQKRDVKSGRVGDEFVEILDGVKEGDRVVTAGNLLIDAEAQLATSQ